MDIPSSPTAITAAWIAEILGDDIGDAGIASLEITDIGEGTGIFGEIARVAITYDRDDAPGPASVVVKLPCVEPENLAVATALGLYEREVRFFDEIAATTQLRVPRCHHAQLADDGRFVLVLEDMGTDFVVGDQVEGATAAEAERIVDALADLHAAWWESEALDSLEWLPVPDAPAYMGAVPDIYRTGLPVLERDWSDRLPAAAIDAARALEPRFEELMHRIAEAPRTFAHSDPRLDNVFFARDGSDDVAFIDFQLSLRQRGVTDLAYLIGTSVKQDVARTEWERLVRRWYDRIVGLGVDDYAWHDCVRHYKEAVLYYLCGAMSLIGSFDTGNERGEAMATAYTTRICNHVVDVDALAVL